MTYETLRHTSHNEAKLPPDKVASEAIRLTTVLRRKLQETPAYHAAIDASQRFPTKLLEICNISFASKGDVVYEVNDGASADGDQILLVKWIGLQRIIETGRLSEKEVVYIREAPGEEPEAEQNTPTAIREIEELIRGI